MKEYYNVLFNKLSKLDGEFSSLIKAIIMVGIFFTTIMVILVVINYNMDSSNKLKPMISIMIGALFFSGVTFGVIATFSVNEKTHDYDISSYTFVDNSPNYTYFVDGEEIAIKKIDKKDTSIFGSDQTHEICTINAKEKQIVTNDTEGDDFAKLINSYFEKSDVKNISKEKPIITIGKDVNMKLQYKPINSTEFEIIKL